MQPVRPLKLIKPTSTNKCQQVSQEVPRCSVVNVIPQYTSKMIIMDPQGNITHQMLPNYQYQLIAIPVVAPVSVPAVTAPRLLAISNNAQNKIENQPQLSQPQRKLNFAHVCKYGIFIELSQVRKGDEPHFLQKVPLKKRLFRKAGIDALMSRDIFAVALRIINFFPFPLAREFAEPLALHTQPLNVT